MRLIAHYQNFSLQFGLKLPTGRFDQNFVTGPQTCEPLFRGLPFDTCTTNLLVGAKC